MSCLVVILCIFQGWVICLCSVSQVVFVGLTHILQHKCHHQVLWKQKLKLACVTTFNIECFIQCAMVEKFGRPIQNNSVWEQCAVYEEQLEVYGEHCYARQSYIYGGVQSLIKSTVLSYRTPALHCIELYCTPLNKTSSH